MTFQGFPPQALPFFKALAFHQTKEWFEQNRETYESAVKAPLGDLVDDAAARLAKAKIPIKGDRKSSLFRNHRDVRFSNNKDPYKTNAGVAMTRSGAKGDPGVLYFHLSPEGCFFTAGFHNPDPPQLAKLRAAAARTPKLFQAADCEACGRGPEPFRRGRAEAPAARIRGDRRPRDRRGDPFEEFHLPAAGRGGADPRAGARRRLLRLRFAFAAAPEMGLERAGRFALEFP